MNNRLQILTDEEIAVLYARPDFNDTERRHFFLLTDTVLKMLKIDGVNARSTPTKIYFILQYGYFKARHQFFTMSYAEAKDDVSFIMAHYMPNDSLPKKLPTRKMKLESGCF